MIELEPGLSAQEIIAIRRSLCLMGYHVVRIDPLTSVTFCAYCDCHVDNLTSEENRKAIREAYALFRPYSLRGGFSTFTTSTTSYFPKAPPLDIHKRTPPNFLTDKFERDHTRKKGKYAILSHSRR